MFKRHPLTPRLLPARSRACRLLQGISHFKLTLHSMAALAPQPGLPTAQPALGGRAAPAAGAIGVEHEADAAFAAEPRVDRRPATLSRAVLLGGDDDDDDAQWTQGPVPVRTRGGRAAYGDAGDEAVDGVDDVPEREPVLGEGDDDDDGADAAADGEEGGEDGDADDGEGFAMLGGGLGDGDGDEDEARLDALLDTANGARENGGASGIRGGTKAKAALGGKGRKGKPGGPSGKGRQANGSTPLARGRDGREPASARAKGGSARGARPPRTERPAEGKKRPRALSEGYIGRGPGWSGQ